MVISGNHFWDSVVGLAFYKNVLFALGKEGTATLLNELTMNGMTYDRSGDLSDCKTLTTVNNSLYTFDKQLYQLSFPTPNKAIKTAIGHYQINPSVVAGIPPKYLFLVENGQYHTMDVQTGQGKKLTGKGNASAAVYCYGYLFVIDAEGDIWTINPDTGEKVVQITIGGKFKGSRGLACYQSKLYAVHSKNEHMYEINPKKWDKFTPVSLKLRFPDAGLMTSYSGNP